VGLDAFQQSNDLWTPNELFTERSQSLPGESIENGGRSQYFNWNASAVHNYSVGGWSLGTSGGIQYEDRQLNTSRIRTQNLIPGERNVGQGTSTTGVENLTQERTIALYAQEEVRLLNELLLLQAGLRAERSSVNGDIDKFHVFPKVSGSYRIVDLIGPGSEIKPRIAYGETGNLPTFGQKFTTLGTPQLGGTQGFIVNAASGFADVSPERVKEIEVGIDGIALAGRLTWELTGFDRNTTNLLLQRVPAPSSGFTTQIFNGGKIQNRGFEAALALTPIERDDMTWVSRTTFTAYESEVKDLAGLPSFRPPLSGFGGLGVTFIEVGQPLTQLVGFDYDANGERTATTVQLGNTAPDFRMGFVNDFTYRGINLSVVLDYQQGGDIINLTRYLYDDAGTSSDFGSEAYLARVKAQADGVMTPYIEDGSFVKLREISIGTNLPQRWIQGANLGVRDVRVALSGRNLATWTDYSGLDPEVGNLGSAAIRNNLDVAPYPPSRSIFLDISVGF
jgi:hypothetical protein